MKELSPSIRLVKRVIMVSSLSYILTSEAAKHGKLIAFAATLIWLIFDHKTSSNEEDNDWVVNHEERLHHKVSTAVMDLVCDYDPTICSAVINFRPVVRASRCLFAKAAVLWGSMDYSQCQRVDTSQLIVDQIVQKSVPMLLKFLERSDDENLDGFIFEIPDKEEKFGSCVQTFASLVRRVLCTISDMDPAREFSARKRYVGDNAWYFTFANKPIFVTTFAPCYKSTHSRFTYGVKSCFILLQPEVSFLRHNLPFDTPQTNWQSPQTIRDRIRISFWNAGQEYYIPRSRVYPAAEHIVKPLIDDGQHVVKWWTKEAELAVNAFDTKSMLLGSVSKTEHIS